MQSSLCYTHPLTPAQLQTEIGPTVTHPSHYHPSGSCTLSPQDKSSRLFPLFFLESKRFTHELRVHNLRVHTAYMGWSKSFMMNCFDFVSCTSSAFKLLFFSVPIIIIILKNNRAPVLICQTSFHAFFWHFV